MQICVLVGGGWGRQGRGLGVMGEGEVTSGKGPHRTSMGLGPAGRPPAGPKALRLAAGAVGAGGLEGLTVGVCGRSELAGAECGSWIGTAGLPSPPASQTSRHNLEPSWPEGL